MPGGFRGLIVLLVFWSVSVVAQAQPEMTFNCRFDPETGVLRLIGPTDDSMLSCVEAMPDGRVETIRITSTGGDVGTALSIADIIARWNVHLIVVRECNSSCANYFLPVARRVTALPRSTIMLHGSVDQGLIARLDDADQRAALQRVADRQAAFAERHNIPPGWLLYRRQYTGGIGGIEGLRGELFGGVPLTRASRLIVAELLFRSCLPHVELDPFEGTTADLASSIEAVRERLARQGAHVSGSLRCT